LGTVHSFKPLITNHPITLKKELTTLGTVKKGIERQQLSRQNPDWV
jgi:hypothetical protein